MKNMTIKTFITFMFLSLLIMGTVYLTLFLVTPYSSVKKNREYIEKESQTLADKCMNLSKAEAERLIHGFASRTGTYTELLEAENYLEREDSMIEESYPLHFSDQQQEYMLCITRSDDRAQSFRQNIIKSIPTVLIIALILSIIGSRIFSYYMKKPIVRMSRIAERMAEQDFDWYCPDERDDEIGRLAKSLNKLSDELSAALEKLSDKNLYLKNEITLEKERERRRMLFFSGVSHELKTPISVVIGQIEGMRSGIGVYKDRDKYLEKCSNTLNELVSFINEILLVSHIDMGDMDAQEIVKIDSILDEEIAFYDGLITEKNIELEYEVPDNVDFRGNEQLLKKALGNILGNAFKYTPEGGKVSVRLESQKEAENKSGKVNLTITNSPAHIDEQHLPHLFEAFYRADTSNKDGSGLGLYITGMVLEMFGAEYKIENTEDGVKFKVEQI
ncbi:sensor histidine kinase [Eubacterium ruminantium]|uniref:sensor histidine kinase n=1 Tax=Eubacterium ruminantium TaxID=42322 RepID=UPI001569275E|nr:HAMP domain-containing sensor histidine kinase [Eubacterium ruminantium]